MKKQTVAEMRRPYSLSSIMLSFYALTIVVLSKDRALVDLSQYTGFGLACIFVLEYLFSRQRKLLLPIEFIGFWIFLTLMVMSALWAPEPDISITLSLTFFQLLVFGVVAINILVSRRSIMPLAIGLVAGLLWAVFVALNENDFSLAANAVSSRIGSVLVNPNSYAISLFMGCMVVGYLYQSSNNKLVKMLLVGSALLFLQQIIFYSGSRKGIVAIFLIYPVYLLLQQTFRPNRRLPRFILTCCLILGFCVVAWQIVEHSPFFYRIEGLQYEIVEGMRGNMVRYGVELWRDKPLLGQGAGQFGIFHYSRTYSHNNYVELLANNGLIGLLAYYSFFVLLLRKYLHLFRTRHLAVSWLAWLLSFVLMLLFFDMGMVSYYEKTTWLSYIVLVVIGYMFQSDEKPLWRIAQDNPQQKRTLDRSAKRIPDQRPEMVR